MQTSYLNATKPRHVNDVTFLQDGVTIGAG